MERKGLSGTEAYPCGLSSVPDNSLQPMRLCVFKGNISRFQGVVKDKKKCDDFYESL